MAEPWLFPDIPSLHAETQVYTSRQKNSVSPGEYKYTVEDLANFILANFNFSGRQSIVVNGSGSLEIPLGKFLDVIIVISDNSTQSVTIEDTDDPDLVLDSEQFTPNQNMVLRVDLYGGTTGKTINVTCDNSVTIIYFLK